MYTGLLFLYSTVHEKTEFSSLSYFCMGYNDQTNALVDKFKLRIKTEPCCVYHMYGKSIVFYNLIVKINRSVRPSKKQQQQNGVKKKAGFSSSV